MESVGRRISMEIHFMAEICSPSSHGRPNAGVQRAKRLSTRVDLTPMVDLGFLLITFFVFTTSMTAPNVLNLALPADGDSSVTAESKTLNLVLEGDNRIHYYIGNEVGNRNCTDFSPEGVRKVIFKMQQRVQNSFGDAAELVILIRPTEHSSYMNLVDILDEMLIMDVRKYALMDGPADAAAIGGKPRPPC